MKKEEPNPKCNNCGKKLIYVGEHYSDEEGWCSTYMCKICSKVSRINYMIGLWNAHLRKCKNKYCARCGGRIYNLKGELKKL